MPSERLLHLYIPGLGQFLIVSVIAIFHIFI